MGLLSDVARTVARKPKTGRALEELLGGAGLAVVDVGARGGAMPSLIPLARFVHYAACEPDTQEQEALRRSLARQAGWRKLTVFSEALALNEGEAWLHVTRQPGLSSLLVPDQEITRRYYENGEFDVQKKIPVRTITLDQAAARYGFEQAALLKLDTQGSELEILRSGPKLLEVLSGVYLEAEFQPFYKNQPLFSDVDAYLRQKGFELFDLFRSSHRRAGFRKERYSRRQVHWVHALYLRRMDAHAAAEPRIRQTLARLLAVALAFDHWDYCFELAAAFAPELLRDLEAYSRLRTRAVASGLRGRRRRSLFGFAHKDRDGLEN